MNKKGFTLIEMIISLTLITILGVSSVVGIKYVNKNIRISKLDEITDKALLAAKVYIETNKETYNQLYNKQNGIIIPLNVLVNEGLLSLKNTDLKKSDYEDEYIVTALTDTKGEGCIDITTNASWNLSKDNPIYICSSNDGFSTDDLKDKIKYESSHETYVAKGENPNNWVEFEVTSDNTKVAYFPNDEDKDLWRMVSIDEKGQIKLIYPKPVPSNNDLMYDKSKVVYRSYSDYSEYYGLKYYNYIPEKIGNGSYYRYKDNGWNILELLNDIDDLKKKELYNAIVNKKWLINDKYYPYYNLSSCKRETRSLRIEELETSIGLINEYEVNESYSIGKSWLSSYFLFIGLSYGVINDFSRSQCLIYSYNGNIIATGILGPDSISCGTGEYCYELVTYDYHPVITLNEKVELKEQICPEGKELGSKECPYKLECKNC